MSLVPYERPRGAVHDLNKLAEIAAGRCRILCVSDRTLYLLANFAAVDVSFFSRFAVELKDTGYVALDRADPEYVLYEQIKTAFQLEVLDMSCDIETGLLAIADAIASQTGGGGCGGEYASPVLNCIVDLPNDELLGPDDSTQGSPGVDPPPDGFETWAEYFDYKCKAAAFIWDLERKHMVMLRNFEGAALVASIVGPSVAGLLGVLPAAMTPAGFAVFVASVVAIGLVAAASWFYMDEMIDEWDDNKDDIICSLYNSGSSAQAVSALSNALEDAIQAIVTWGALGPVSGTISGLLSTSFAQIAGNGIVEPLFKAAVAASEFEHDCDDCNGDAILVRTAFSSPFNVVEIGEEGEDGEDDTASQGWKSCNNLTQLTVEFTTPNYTISEWRLRYWVGFGSSHVERTPQTFVEKWDGDSWESFWSHTWDSVWADGETELDITVDDESLQPNTLYRLRPFVFEYLNCLWSQRHTIGPAE